MTDTDLRALLRELAPVRCDGEPIVSLYVHGQFSDEQQRERARLFVREAVKLELDRHAAHPQRPALERTLARVEGEALARIEQSLSETPGGLAILACQEKGLWRVIQLGAKLQPALHVNARCHLLQLARLLDGVEPAIVAVVSGKGARVYEIALGEVVGEAAIEGPLPRSRRAGGHEPRPAAGRQVHGAASGDSANIGAGGFQYERSQKNQRHAEKLAEQNRNAAAAFLTQRFDQHAAHVVLLGPREVCASFERALPQRVRERVILRAPQPPAPANGAGARDVLLRRALEAVESRERQSDREAVDAAIGEAKRGGLAVLGPEDVVLAVNERRVHRLILEEDFERTGWMCRNCGAIGISHADACTYCAGPLAWVEALGEEIAGRVIADDGEVDVVPHTQRLHAYAGVAAMLRQARARGLGVSPGHAPRA